MRRKLLFLLLLCAATLRAWGHNDNDTLGIGGRVNFVKNMGQTEKSVLFEAQMGRAALFLEKDAFTIALRQVVPHDSDKPFHHSIYGRRGHAYKVHFVGANTTTDGATPASVEGLGQVSTYNNYFRGRDRSHWRSHVPLFDNVVYHNLWPGVDMQVYGAQRALKYDFTLAPNADPKQIMMEYEGADALRLDQGNLVVRTSVCRIVEAAPYAYQIVAGDTIRVEARYVLDKNRITFDIGSYDHGLPLVIDPQLYFSTYTGSTADNWGTTATFDSYKNTYAGGIVFDIGYPVSVGAFDTMYHGNVDVAIFKFDTTGGERLYATYLGGTYADMPHSMFVNSFDELVVFGTTGSADFPVSNDAYMTDFVGGDELSYLDYYYTHPDASYNHHMWYPTGSDIFVSRFSSDGSELMASTLVGGTGNDGLNFRNRYNDSYTIMMQGNDSLYFNYGDGVRGELITDDLNNVYIGTTTFSTDFPVTDGALQNVRFGEQDGVVFKLDYNLQNMLWSTYLGGTGDDAVYSIDVDSAYNVIVCGGTTSTDFPTTSATLQPTYGGGSTDGFVAKISYNGDLLMHSTYYGSDQYDQCYFVRTGKRTLAYGEHEITLAENDMVGVIHHRHACLCHRLQSGSKSIQTVCNLRVVLNVVIAVEIVGQVLRVLAHQHVVYEAAYKFFVRLGLVQVSDLGRTVNQRVSARISFLGSGHEVVPVLHNFAVLKTEDVKTDFRTEEIVVGLSHYIIAVLKDTYGVHAGFLRVLSQHAHQFAEAGKTVLCAEVVLNVLVCVDVRNRFRCTCLNRFEQVEYLLFLCHNYLLVLIYCFLVLFLCRTAFCCAGCQTKRSRCNNHNFLHNVYCFIGCFSK